MCCRTVTLLYNTDIWIGIFPLHHELFGKALEWNFQSWMGIKSPTFTNLSIFYTAYPIQGHVKLEPIQLILGERWTTPWLPISLACTQPCLLVFSLWRSRNWAHAACIQIRQTYHQTNCHHVWCNIGHWNNHILKYFPFPIPFLFFFFVMTPPGNTFIVT